MRFEGAALRQLLLMILAVGAGLSVIGATSATPGARPLPAWLGSKGPVEVQGERKPPVSREVSDGRFATSWLCEMCHSNAATSIAMLDEKKRFVGPFTLWQGSMMANSARDPFWRAAVSAEVKVLPMHKATIEATCMKCHAPMAMAEAHLNGEKAPGIHLLTEDTNRGQLAIDGVSCTLCHQIRPDGLGTDASYTAGFVIGDKKEIFGPHKDPLADPMVRMSAFTPVAATHMTQSKLCATCHTVITEGRNLKGEVVREHFAEQSPYFEWRNSVFNTELDKPGPDAADCQSCHMPVTSEDGVPIKTRLARTPNGRTYDAPLREPFGRHLFVGGNTLIPAILRDNADELRPLASREAFDFTIQAARDQLQQSTARLGISGPARSNGKVTFGVKLENLTGHKFPSAYPSRRAWLRVRLLDAKGSVLWASGESDLEGRIIGTDGKPLPSELQGGLVMPHRAKITQPDQVQVYETIMADSDGKAVFRLMLACGRFKDNRLLPRGWTADGMHVEDTRPIGVEGDTDFAGGGDEVAFEIAVADDCAEVEVTLLYQTLAARYAAELFAFDTPEIKRFRGYYEKAARGPEEVASAKVKVPK